jgi:hypothetical protein
VQHAQVGLWPVEGKVVVIYETYESAWRAFVRLQAQTGNLYEIRWHTATPGAPFDGWYLRLLSTLEECQARAWGKAAV